jgi:hypothetical protein
MPRRRIVRSAWDDTPLSKDECLEFYNTVASEQRVTEAQRKAWLAGHPGQKAPAVESFISKAEARCKELMGMLAAMKTLNGLAALIHQELFADLQLLVPASIFG